jgi:hypothetical protein
MTHQPNRSDPIDRTLDALRNAAPPEGMEARVLQTLEAQRAAGCTPSQPGAPFMRSRKDAHEWVASHSAWLGGALTGALIATAACALAFYVTRPHRHTQPQLGANTSQPSHSITATPVSMAANAATPCTPDRVAHSSRGITHDELGTRVPHPGSAWVGNVATTTRVPHSSQPYRDEWEVQHSHAPRLIPASFAPSKPAPPTPLTPQERALAQLAANPAALAALTHTADQKSDAQREADFQKFFAPSPELVAAEKAQDEALGLAKATDMQPTKDQN